MMKKQQNKQDKVDLNIHSDVRAGIGWLPEILFGNLGWSPYEDQTLDVPKSP